jgi:hypothetical protein
MDRKYFKCGTIKIIVKYTDKFTFPKFWGNMTRPEYKITLISACKTKRRITAWGNIADPPDTQHRSMAECVLQEVIQDPEDFSDFCFNFGYSDDSLRAFKVWKMLVKQFDNGFWLKEAEVDTVTNEPVIVDAEKFVSVIGKAKPKARRDK